MIFDVFCSILIGVFIGLCIFLFIPKTKIYRGPNSKLIKSRIYKTKSGKCYVLEPKIYLCPR